MVEAQKDLIGVVINKVLIKVKILKIVLKCNIDEYIVTNEMYEECNTKTTKSYYDDMR